MSPIPLQNKRFFRRAFTLIEMLIVASLLSVTGLAVYNAIANGLRVWEYSRRYSAEEDVAIFFEKISGDLHNTYAYSLIEFEGKADKIFIPTIVRMPADLKTPDKNHIIQQMGAVEYFFQKGKKTIYRRQSNYSQALKTKKKFQAQSLATSVEGLRFIYFFFEDGKIKPKKAVSKQIPVSVLVEVDFAEVGGNIRHLQRIINIPMGQEK